MVYFVQFIVNISQLSYRQESTDSIRIVLQSDLFSKIFASNYIRRLEYYFLFKTANQQNSFRIPKHEDVTLFADGLVFRADEPASIHCMDRYFESDVKWWIHD